MAIIKLLDYSPEFNQKARSILFRKRNPILKINKKVLYLIFGIVFAVLSYSGHLFYKKQFTRTGLDKRINGNQLTTFLLCGFNSKKELDIAIMAVLFPKERKLALYFVNPIISFEEETLEKSGKKASLKTLKEGLQKITGAKINYIASLSSENFERAVDILGGVSVYIDPWTIKQNSAIDKKIGEYTFQGFEISEFLKPVNPGDPNSYLERLSRQESIVLGIYDKVRELDKTFRKEWIYFFANLIESDLTPEELFAFYSYIKEGHLGISIAEMPAEPVMDKDNKTQILKVKEEAAGIAYSSFISGLRSEDFADGEFSRVEVLNGTEINGLAKRVKSLLNEKRFKVLATDNGWVPEQKKTIIISRSGVPEFAYKISGALGIKNVKHIIYRDLGLDVTILLGEDFDNKSGKN